MKKHTKMLEVKGIRHTTYQSHRVKCLQGLLAKGLECKIIRWAVNLGTLEYTYYFLAPSVSYVAM